MWVRTVGYLIPIFRAISLSENPSAISERICDWRGEKFLRRVVCESVMDVSLPESSIHCRADGCQAKWHLSQHARSNATRGQLIRSRIAQIPPLPSHRGPQNPP